MNTSESSNAAETSLTQDLFNAARYYLGGRRGLILLTVVALGAGAVLNWSWLVAVGIAPLLLAIAPCAAMCALGLCMNKAMGKSCSTESGETDQSHARAGADLTVADRSDAAERLSTTIAPSEAQNSITTVAVGSKHSEPLDGRKS